jgi:hypothetical protein
MESTVFQQLLQAVLSYQTGTVNIRRILSPLFTEETADEENRQFYTEYDAASAYERSRVDHGIENSGLYLPARLEPAHEPEPNPDAPVYEPDDTSPPEPPVTAPPADPFAPTFEPG